MTMPSLTPREAALVDAVERLTARQGYAPSLREIGEEIGVHRSRAARLAHAATAKGAMRRCPRVPRSLVVVRRVAT